MLNKLREFIDRHQLICPGDTVICAVSGGADSVAMLFAFYLLREKLKITLSAAHFNHGLRGEESDRDEEFVRAFCDRYEIPLFVGSGDVEPGKKGLEAAARDARYAFLRSLTGKIATAHTADDNAETVLMHLVRGTGLRGLGGIMPINGQLIRPMLSVTREDVLAFLKEYHLDYVTDSSNRTDDFLRNRLRHHVMPILRSENPSVAENVSAMALRLRCDEEVLQSLADAGESADVYELRRMHRSVRLRWIHNFLKTNGVLEPEAQHIQLVERLTFSDKPSARAYLPGGVVITRNYNVLEKRNASKGIVSQELEIGSEVKLSDQKIFITCLAAEDAECTINAFAVIPKGKIVVRSRQAGDRMRLSGGTKDLKKIFIDRKIPANRRGDIPVVADEEGVLGVYGVGANLDRLGSGNGAVKIQFVDLTDKER